MPQPVSKSYNLLDVIEWGKESGQSVDAIREAKLLPARLGLLDADIRQIPADLQYFERACATSNYALVSRSKDIHAAERRANSRIRALLKRFHQEAVVPINVRETNARDAWDALMTIVKEEEGRPGTGARWNVGRHRSLTVLRARARCGPAEFKQGELDCISTTVSAEGRKALRRAIKFLNSLRDIEDMPQLTVFLPPRPLIVPRGSARARKMDWTALPKSFRGSFDAAVKSCIAGTEDVAELFLARIEAGEDPKVVSAEADAEVHRERREVGNPAAAESQYRGAVAWVARAHEDRGGDLSALGSLGELLRRPHVEAAIEDQITRSVEGHDLKDPLGSTTMKSRLVALTTLARHGLRDDALAAILTILRRRHYDKPRAKRKAHTGENEMAVADKIAAMLSQKPSLVAIYSNAPSIIAEKAREEIAMARGRGSLGAELTALRRVMAATAYAIQVSRPLRTANLRNIRIRTEDDILANMVRTDKFKGMRFVIQPWETKTNRRVELSIYDGDAEIVRQWIRVYRARYIQLRGIENTPYLFPGGATPCDTRSGGPRLPFGCIAGSSFLEIWDHGSAALGVSVSPHRMRHVVAMLILALRPGDYGFVASVLGNTADVARRHYGRDNGEAAAGHARAAILAAHPNIMRTLRRRTDS